MVVPKHADTYEDIKSSGTDTPRQEELSSPLSIIVLTYTKQLAPIDTPEQTQRHREQASIGWPPVDEVSSAPTYGQAVFDTRMCGKWKVFALSLTNMCIRSMLNYV